MDALAELNDAQLEAVTATEGFVRVIAGAGSGKTKTLACRFAYLVEELGILPGNILCVTFSNKSAAEMRQRIHNLTGDSDTGYIATFHSFCVSILQEDSHAVGYPKSFLVLDNSDIDDMLRIIYEERGLSLRDMSFGDARDMIEIRKLFKKPDYYLDMMALSPEALKEKYLSADSTDDIIFYGYLYQEKKCFGLDYNDLIFFSLFIFRRFPELREKWQKRLEYIMIDEFQDIDKPQYELMEVLCDYHKNLFIVGDPDQTIYTWRGASVKYLLDFDRHFPGTRTVMMTKNYRSTPEILAAANSLIGKNKTRIPKDLCPTLPGGARVVCHYAATAEAEAEWIADEIQRLRAENVSPRDVALLYRAHYVTRTIEEVFQRRKIPYTIYSGVQFFCRKEIKDALAYLRMAVLRDDLSFARIINLPKRNMGQRRMDFLKETAAAEGTSLYDTLKKHLDNEIFKGTGAARFVHLMENAAEGAAERPVSELLNELLDRSGYEALLRTEGSQERLDNLAELKQSVHEYEVTCGEESTPEHYLRRVALFTNSDAAPEGERVKLMTVHTAKGLEFPCVFLPEMNEGVFPSKKVRTPEGMEEERRLAFVALTRARQRLYLSDANGRNFDGSPRYPSRFLLDIDPALLEFTHAPEDRLIADARYYIAAADKAMDARSAGPRFAVGSRVRHSVMGPGTVTALDTEKGAYTISFDRLSTPRTISFRVKMEEA